MSKRLTIFDSDSIIFIVAYQFRNKKSAKMVEMHTSKFITDILANSKATHYVGFFGSKMDGAKPNFRYDVDPNYKANRPPTPDFVVKWRPTILKCFEEKWGFIPVEGMEADDAVAITHNYYKDQFDEMVIVSADKDLKQLPNSIFYNMNKHQMTKISEFDAYKNLALQMLTGDKSTDNIPGLPGIGPKKAEVILKDCDSIESLKRGVIRAYSNIEETQRDKVLKAINKEIKGELGVLVLNNEELPAEYKGLSGARLDRRIRINTAKKVSQEMSKFMPGGWKDYLRQQSKLLAMLTEAPDFFTVPVVQDSPMASLVEGIATTSNNTSSTEVAQLDDFLTI